MVPTLLTFSVPTFFLVESFLIAFILGAIIGSFLNVYIYRFHTGKSLSGNSHCLSCGKWLRWFELVPIISYVWIRGRCRQCHCRVPIRYLLVETLTAVLFVWTLTITTNLIEIAIVWFILALLVVILTYDIYHFIIPDSLTVALLISVGVLVGYEHLLQPYTWFEFGWLILSALLGSAFFLFLWLVSKGVWLGFGDVKLAFPLGLLVGASGVFSFIVLSFWIGAVVSLLLLGIQKWQQGKSHLRFTATPITIKSAVPFAPFLIAGALVVFFTNFNVLSLFYFA